LIEVGSDCILDLGRKALLSPSLRAQLHEKSLFYLHQFYSPSKGGLLGDSWLNGADLLLDLNSSIEWNGYIQLLIEAGIRLHPKADLLIWTGGNGSGQISAKNVYLALASRIWKPIKHSCRQRIWRDECPTKLKLFTWLLLENKLLFWDNLQARGWIGPSRCPLCKCNIESTQHVFIHCTFAREIWTRLASILNFTLNWTGINILACFQNWYTNHNTFTLLPIHLCWQVWKTRNAAIFNEKIPSIHTVTTILLTEANLSGNNLKAKPSLRQSFPIPIDRAVAWFDGASQQRGTLCGAGGKIILNHHTCIRWTLNGGQGTNAKAELLGAWASLVLASRHTDTLLLLGDSKNTIDWLNGRADFKVAALDCWKERTKDASQLFRNLTFQHIFREENSEADSLSKKALHQPSSQICFTVWEDGIAGLAYKIRI
jgi:ribonuclease HI